MFKRYGLCAAAAVFVFGFNAITIGRSGDWFEGWRDQNEQVAPDSEEEPVGVVFERSTTNSGDDTVRLKPVEGALDTVGNILGGGNRDRHDRRYEERNRTRDNRNRSSQRARNYNAE